MHRVKSAMRRHISLIKMDLLNSSYTVFIIFGVWSTSQKLKRNPCLDEKKICALFGESRAIQQGQGVSWPGGGVGIQKTGRENWHSVRLKICWDSSWVSAHGSMSTSFSFPLLCLWHNLLQQYLRRVHVAICRWAVATTDWRMEPGLHASHWTL